MTAPRSVCVLGAGSSGIAAAKALYTHDIPFVCFEKSDRVGGNWVFGNTNGMSSAYRGLHINTSRDRMAYSDFPMPRSLPDFPHHTQIAAYFEAYVNHFGFRDHIRFNTTVERVERAPRGRWSVRLDTGESQTFDAVMVANGHHWDPQWPDPPFKGEFTGEVMHSHHYLDPRPYEGKTVVLVGMGNSAMDLAVELSSVASRTLLSARRGVWVVPKYLVGRPLDTIITRAGIPWTLRQKIIELGLRVLVGDMTRYGLPRPDHRPGEAHPTISGRILDCLTHGTVTPKPEVSRLHGENIHFTDGSVERADALIYCTGYKVTFPFFDHDLLSAPDNDLPLFRRVFHPDIQNLYFIGLVQPLGAIMPLAEAQSEWAVDHIQGSYTLPDIEAMRRDIRSEREVMFKRYVKSRRHTMQVDFDDYLADLARERRAGARRSPSLTSTRVQR